MVCLQTNNSSGVRFNEVPEKVPKVPEKVWEAFGAEPGQVQQGSGEGSGEGPEKVPGGFGAEQGQVQQGSGKGSGEGSRKPWCQAKLILLYQELSFELYFITYIR